MNNKLAKLTDAQKDRMASWAQEWTEYGLRTEPLTDAEWRTWYDGVVQCYKYADIPLPATVVRVPSPLVGAFAAPIANFLIGKIFPYNSTQAYFGAPLWASVNASVRNSVEDTLISSLRDDSVRDSVDASFWSPVWDSVENYVSDSTPGSVWDSVGASVWDSVRASVWDSVRASVGALVSASVRKSVSASVRSSVRSSVGASVGDSVWASVSNSVRDSVWSSVWASVSNSVWDSVWSSVWNSVWHSVNASVGASVWASVSDSVSDSVSKEVKTNWHKYHGGRLWCYWESYVSFFRDVIGVDLGESDMRSRAYQNSQSAGWWWSLSNVIMVCDLPTKIATETVSGIKRLHCENGPAIEWPGFKIYSWHGTRVPEWVITEPTIEKAMREENSEVRRSAFEVIGWERIISELDTAPIDVCPDPGNPHNELKLYKLPEKINSYGQPVNLLLMTNGSPDRNGNLRRYGETVPSHINNALEAAAWQYGVKPDVYSKIARRT